MKYIKAFHETLKNEGKMAEYAFYAMISTVGYIITGGLYEATRNKYIGIVDIIMVIINIYFIMRFLYIVIANDLKQFFKKVKSNVK